MQFIHLYLIKYLYGNFLFFVYFKRAKSTCIYCRLRYYKLVQSSITNLSNFMHEVDPIQVNHDFCDEARTGFYRITQSG